MSREVPRARAIVLRPSGCRYALVLPVWNEGDRLHRQLARLAPYVGICDVIVSDKPSTDGSTEPADLERRGVHALITLEEAGGYSSSLRAAIAYALDAGYGGILFMDGNDKDDPSAIPAFARGLDDGLDYVQGSRYARGGRAIGHPIGRTLMIRLIHAPLFSLATRRWWTDTTNGFRAFSRRALCDERLDLFRSEFSRYELPTYLAWKVVRLGYAAREIPVTRAYPTGPVPTKIRGLRQHWRMLRPLLMVLLARW